jgi:hypothetical protein
MNGRDTKIISRGSSRTIIEECKTIESIDKKNAAATAKKTLKVPQTSLPRSPSTGD